MSFSLWAFIHQHGVIGVALGAGAEGETAVVVGGGLARHGLFHPMAAAIAAALGSFVADQLFFFLGRMRREAKLVRQVVAKPVFARALALIDRRPLLFCLGFRFVYGLRIAGPIAIGVSLVPTSRFVVLNLLSAAIWGSIFTAIGYSFGRIFESYIRRLLTPEHLVVVVGLLLVGTGLWGMRRNALESLDNKAS